MSGTAIMPVEPVLRGDFGLITIAERVGWREALPRNLLARMHQANGNPLAAWKVDEQVRPTLATIHELFNNDSFATLQTLEEYFVPASLSHRSDYAS